ncbi:MAG: DUF4080 domain-containing protein [Clostridiales bacterium]|nr:DUF4080 domain-containing protein [Candidatus Crickella merdequi]
MKVLLTTIRTDCVQSQLTLKYLYSVLSDAPIELSMVEYAESDVLSRMYTEIAREQYNVVYMHCDEENEARITALAELVKKALPSSVVMIGGIHVTFGTRAFMMQNPCIDFVVRGEPERVMFNFLKTLITYEFDFEGIAGLAYRANDEIYINPLDIPLQMDDLPFPYEKVRMDSFGEVYYETIRGTSDRCAYAQFLPDARVRSLSLNRICTELRYFLVKETERVVITDKYFNYNTERAYRIWEYLINNDNGKTTFVFDINGDAFDDETIRLLENVREGYFEFNVDVESTNAETLAAVGRKENIYQLFYNISKLIQKTKIKINVTAKIGLPYETELLFARSFNKIFGLGAHTTKIEPLMMKKGSLLKGDAGRYGYQYSSRAPFEVIATDYINAIDMIRIKSIAKIVDLYIGNGGFEQSLQRMMTDTGMKAYDFFARLADFIRVSGYEKKLGKTEHLYRILYAFATNIYDEMNDTLKLQIIMEVIHSDLENSLSEESVKKFERKGWVLEV